MRSNASFRGQPLLLLVGLLGGWCVLRAITWQPLLPIETAIERAMLGTPLAATAPRESGAFPASLAGGDHRGGFVSAALAAPLPPLERPLLPVAPAVPLVGPPLRPWSLAAGHTLMMLAGLSSLDVPAPILALLEDDPDPRSAAPLPAPVPLRPEIAAGRRWTAQGWLFLRGEAGSGLAPGGPVYGRSQAGGIVRFRLGSGGDLAPEAHVRATAALAGPRERELAAGLSLRPLAGAPVRVFAEARVSEREGATSLRPAIFAVTELPPVRLSHGLAGEAYVQAGYVGGEEATAFIDGQARAEARLAGTGEMVLAVGGATWGGAQRGAARLDVGPTASLRFRLGETHGRLAADYRFRLAGDAEPASGPALTLSAGF